MNPQVHNNTRIGFKSGETNTLTRTRSFLSIDPRGLGQLNAYESTELFRDILRCEAIKCGLSPQHIVISLTVTKKDHGIDAKIDGARSNSALLGETKTCFQIKAGAAFKPWQRSQIVKELFGSSKVKPSRARLAKGIRECLETGGRYFIIAFGHDLTPYEHTNSVNELTQLLEECGFVSPAVNVYGQGQIAMELERFPSLCIDLLGFSGDKLYTTTSWGNSSSMQLPLKLGVEQQEFLDSIRNAIYSDVIQHIRVIGEPGIGKTRLLLEAVSASDLSGSVIYFRTGEDFQESGLFFELLKPDNNLAGILVIDDCDSRDRASIWGQLQGKSGISLITVDHGPEGAGDSTTELFNCPVLPDDQVKEIINEYVADTTNLSHWAEWCSGSPRVAHAVGENLRSNPDDILRPPATVDLWERFVLGHKQMGDADARDHLIILRHLSLFTRFGFEVPVVDEAKFVWQLINDANPAITWQRFQDIVQLHRERRILQGRHTLFFVPKALHIYLWRQFWDRHGRDFDFQRYMDSMPYSLRRWFLDLFIYAHHNPVAQAVVSEILSLETGPFSSQAFVESDVGTQLLNTLAEANAEETLSVIEATYGHWPPSKLREWRGGRQRIVWALEKIAVWPALFSRAVDVLVSFALTESETHSNNSTGTLLGLFKFGLGWAATMATPEERLPVLFRLVRGEPIEQQTFIADNEDVSLDQDTNDGVDNRARSFATRREIGLEMCVKWLGTRGGYRTGGPEYQGARSRIEFWRPKTYGEIYDGWRKVWFFLREEIRGWPDSERTKGANALIRAAVDLWHVPAIADEVIDTLFELSDDPSVDKEKLIHFVIGVRFNPSGKDVDEGAYNRIVKLDEKLTGVSLLDRIDRFVLHTNWSEYRQYRQTDNSAMQKQENRIKGIAAEVMSSSYTSHVQVLMGKEGHLLVKLGYECGLIATREQDTTILHMVAEGHAANGQFLGGYASGIREQAPGRWRLLMQTLLSSDNTLSLGVECTWRSGLDGRVVSDLLCLFRQGKVGADVFSGLRFYQREDALKQEIMLDVFWALIESTDTNAITVCIELSADWFGDFPQSIQSAEDLIFRILTHGRLFTDRSRDRNDTTMRGYYWKELCDKYLVQFPHKEVPLLSNLVGRVEGITLFWPDGYIREVANSIVKKHPMESWKSIAKLLEKGRSDCFGLLDWLGDEGTEDNPEYGMFRTLRANDVIDWVRQDLDERLGLIIDHLPKTLDRKDGGELTCRIIEEFGSNESFDERLMVNMWIGGWWGHESTYLSRKRESARNWLSNTNSDRIQTWLSKYIAHLTKRIESAKIREERDY